MQISLDYMYIDVTPSSLIVSRYWTPNMGTLKWTFEVWYVCMDTHCAHWYISVSVLCKLICPLVHCSDMIIFVALFYTESGIGSNWLVWWPRPLDHDTGTDCFLSLYILIQIQYYCTHTPLTLISLYVSHSLGLIYTNLSSSVVQDSFNMQ